MIAILSLQIAAVVDDEEEAAELALSMESASRLNVEHVLEERGASRSDLDGRLALLGVSLSMLPEAIVE